LLAAGCQTPTILEDENSSSVVTEKNDAVVDNVADLEQCANTESATQICHPSELEHELCRSIKTEL
jgi:hypothetical protein